MTSTSCLKRVQAVVNSHLTNVELTLAFVCIVFGAFASIVRGSSQIAWRSFETHEQGRWNQNYSWSPKPDGSHVRRHDCEPEPFLMISMLCSLCSVLCFPSSLFAGLYYLFSVLGGLLCVLCSVPLFSVFGSLLSVLCGLCLCSLLCALFSALFSQFSAIFALFSVVCAPFSALCSSLLSGLCSLCSVVCTLCSVLYVHIYIYGPGSPSPPPPPLWMGMGPRGGPPPPPHLLIPVVWMWGGIGKGLRGMLRKLKENIRRSTKGKPKENP